MKILDPQSALLTTAEVQHFLISNPPRPPDKRIGAYPSVNLQGYNRVREDFQHYLTLTHPYLLQQQQPHTQIQTGSSTTETTEAEVIPLPEIQKWLPTLVSRLRSFGLTKTEALMLIDLGVGRDRSTTITTTTTTNNGNTETSNPANARANENGDTSMRDSAGENDGDEDEQQQETHWPSDRQMMALVVEELEDRFPNEERIEEIIDVLRRGVVGGLEDGNQERMEGRELE